MMPSQANFEFQKCRQSFRSIIKISSLTWILLHHRVLFMSMVILIGNGLSAFEIPDSSNSSSVRNVVEDSAEYGLHSNSIFLTDDRALHSDSISLDIANKEVTESRQSRSELGGMSMILTVCIYFATELMGLYVLCIVDNSLLFFPDCYKQIAVGKRLYGPLVTESLNNIFDDLKCRELCENYSSKCIGYSFG